MVGEIESPDIATLAARSFATEIRPKLDKLGYARKLIKTDDAIIPSSSGRPYVLHYDLEVFEEKDGGRFVWFVLDSPIPSVASIVSVLAMPSDGAEGMPMACVNLNQKQSRGTYGVVLGHRGFPCPKRPQSWPPLPNELNSPPVSALFDNEPPFGFIGRRAGFPISQDIVDWSLTVSSRLLSQWLEQRDANHFRCACCTGQDDLNASLAVVQGYHSGNGSSFDILFGEGWLQRLFHDDIANRG